MNSNTPRTDAQHGFVKMDESSLKFCRTLELELKAAQDAFWNQTAVEKERDAWRKRADGLVVGAGPQYYDAIEDYERLVKEAK